jgi:TPR repeat protein
MEVQGWPRSSTAYRYAETEEWWRRAAEQGNTDAMFNLGRLLNQPHVRGPAARP